MAGLAFPSDMESLKNYMTFQFLQYNRVSINAGANLTPTGDLIVLPMPEKINDSPAVDWSSHSFQDNVMSMASGAIRSALPSVISGASYELGIIPNPMLVMLFKSPMFKEFSFSWNLAPRNQQESQTLANIVDAFRKGMMPTAGFGAAATGTNGINLGYPDLVEPSFSNNLFPFKTCAIKNIDIDYTGSGLPAFFKDQNPAQVRLRIHLTEIEYWVKQGQ